MKIAVATDDGKTISPHFGRSRFFAIYEIVAGTIVSSEMRQNTFTGHFRGGEHHPGHGEQRRGKDDSEGHKTVVAGLRDCKAVISHGMGRRAWEDLRAQGIAMIVTDETDVEKAVRMYLTGELKDQTEKLH